MFSGPGSWKHHQDSSEEPAVWYRVHSNSGASIRSWRRQAHVREWKNLWVDAAFSYFSMTGKQQIPILIHHILPSNWNPFAKVFNPESAKYSFLALT